LDFNAAILHRTPDTADSLHFFCQLLLFREADPDEFFTNGDTLSAAIGDRSSEPVWAKEIGPIDRKISAD